MDGFVAEIKLFAGNFAPKNWLFCQGQILPIAAYTAVYSLLGTYYGGDGRSTFALPDFRGRIPIGVGQGAGLTGYQLGQQAGAEGFVIATTNMPLHTHSLTGTVTMSGSDAGNDSDTPQNSYPGSVAGSDLYATGSNGTKLGNVQHNLNTSSIGTSVPVNNMQPFLGMSYIICLAGVYPQRP